MADQLLALAVLATVYCLVGAVTFAVFGWDKRCAERGERRVPERTLHALELFGGWPGALLAMQVFRHKRRKPEFYVVTWAIAFGHFLGLSLWLIR